jgi:hypothetical protein
VKLTPKERVVVEKWLRSAEAETDIAEAIVAALRTRNWTLVIVTEGSRAIVAELRARLASR